VTCLTAWWDTSGTAHTLNLSSEANTGLKIPPGQIMGGPIHAAAGQSVDLNIDFNTCASILIEGNGDFRLKPALTAGVVSPNKTGISGQIVDSVSSQPIAGAIVTLQFADKSGTDRVVIQQLTDPAGHFSFCPLAVGAVFDVVSDALTASGTAYNATVVLNVSGGTDLGTVPLVRRDCPRQQVLRPGRERSRARSRRLMEQQGRPSTQTLARCKA